jgi:hypothetical protein
VTFLAWSLPSEFWRTVVLLPAVPDVKMEGPEEGAKGRGEG